MGWSSDLQSENQTGSIPVFSTNNITKGIIMDDPCKKCLIRSCCSKPCLNYAVYVYETKEYGIAGKKVSDHINKMSPDKAIAHILKIETFYFSIKSKQSVCYKKKLS